MSNTKHTKGPWRAKRGVGQMIDMGTTVAELSRGIGQEAAWWIFSDAEEHGDHAADAALVSAAPELLETAQAVVARWDSPDWKGGRHTAEFINALRQAIAKATSTPPSRT